MHTQNNRAADAPLNTILEAGENVTLSGVTFRLEFDWNSVALIEEAAGINLCSTEGNKTLQSVFNSKAVSPSKVRLLWWAALQRHHPMTLDEAGRLIDMKELPRVIAGIATALSKAFSAKDGGEPSDPTQARQ